MYRLSEVAATDIDRLLDYSIREFGVLQTESYYQGLVNCLELLDKNPDIGHSADEIRPGYSRFSHESHIIFYTQTEEDIFIVRILHNRMDPSSHIDDRD